MADPGKNRETDDLRAATAQRLDHRLLLIREHRCVGRTMKCPDRDPAEGANPSRDSGSRIAARDRHECREQLRMTETVLPGTEATGTEAGQVDAVSVDCVARFETPGDRIDGLDHLGPEREAERQLRREHDRWEGRAFGKRL